MKAKPVSEGQFVVRVSDGPARYAVADVSRIVTDDAAASAEDRALLADLTERFRQAGRHTLAAVALGGGAGIEVKGLMADNGTSTDQ